MLTLSKLKSSGVMLAHPAPNDFDPTGWLVSEKLDGIRAVWLPGEGLFSRAANPIHAPEWFLRSLPPIPLDGELYAGRARFQNVSSIVRKKTPIDDEWKQIRYHVFDSPGPGTTAQRLQRVKAAVAVKKSRYVVAVKQETVKSKTDLAERAKAVN